MTNQSLQLPPPDPGLLCEGDNLPILQALSNDPSIHGHVRLVYIDPPFGTGQNFTASPKRTATISRSNNGHIAYGDMFTGEAYLDFLRPRLELMRDILATDGSIYVHTDCKMGHYMKVLLDSIFGANNFRNDITRIKCNPKNFQRYGYGNIKDMILFYSKGSHPVWNTPRDPFSKEDIERLFPKIDADGRRYTTTPLHAPGETMNGPSGDEWKGMKPPPGRHWRSVPSALTELDEAGLIEWSPTGNPRKKIFANEVASVGKFRQDIWNFKDPQYPRYPTEKNLDMLRVIVGASSNPGDLVMDAFCGSGGTLIVAQEMGRKWIGVDNSPVAISICRERLAVTQEVLPESSQGDSRSLGKTRRPERIVG